MPLSLRLVQGVSVAALPPPPFAPASGEAAAAAASSGLPPTLPAALAHVTFCRGDFLGLEGGGVGGGASPPPSSVDVVLCLGVTKWVALNHGDAGILRLFEHLHDVLRPGGRLVLEAQPWSSYIKRAAMTPHVARMYASIRLRPEAFLKTLLGTGPGGGFAAVESVHSVRRAGKSGPPRDIYVLRKA